MLEENILKIQKLLKIYNKKLWVMYNDYRTDKYFSRYISDKIYTASYCFISQRSCYILVHDLDKDNINRANLKNIHVLCYKSKLELKSKLEDIIADLKFIDQISLSYSTKSDLNVDVLGHGLYIDLTNQLKQIYKKYNKKVKFDSAENIMYALSSQKSDLQLKRLKYIADITVYILEKTFESLQIGMSEIDIYNLIRQITNQVMQSINSKEIIAYNMAWENCPMVLTGINLAKSGHTLPSQKPLIKGDTIYFDFGLDVTFKDKEHLCTDVQRMGYALKDGEVKAPVKIQKVFNTLVNSIEDGMDEMKPKVRAYKIDKIVRDKIVKSGYPNYNHATGHPVGHLVHDVGAIITLKLSKLANLELVENAVYTLEPRIQIENGGSIEEMIQVTKYGGIPISKLQKKIYLV